jgi:hypothetical protein
MHNTWTSIIGDESVQERRPSRRRILYRRPLQERRMRCAPAASLPGPSIRPVDVESGSPDGTRIDRERKGGHRSAALRGTLSPKGGLGRRGLGLAIARWQLGRRSRPPNLYTRPSGWFPRRRAMSGDSPRTEITR